MALRLQARAVMILAGQGTNKAGGKLGCKRCATTSWSGVVHVAAASQLQNNRLRRVTAPAVPVPALVLALLVLALVLALVLVLVLALALVRVLVRVRVRVAPVLETRQ